MENLMKDILLGMAVGDALGVPVEFKSRKQLKILPVTGMREFGTHTQPKGTWSDDSSMAFCLVETLKRGYNLEDLAKRFINWRNHGYWAPHGRCFDIGNATNMAIDRLIQGKLPITLCGGRDKKDNGNGSVMRILPLVDYLLILERDINLSAMDRFRIVSEVSSLTHGHPISIISCFILTEFARALLLMKEISETNNHEDIMLESLWVTKTILNSVINLLPMRKEEFIVTFGKFYLLEKGYDVDNISGSGYAVHTLEASIWCLLNTTSYKEAVLRAVNLGDDSDTTGCVTGGLAGILYGSKSIPNEWLDILVKRKEIEKLAKDYKKAYLVL